MKLNKLLILSIGALLLIGCCMVGGVGAEEQNLTVFNSTTNSSVEDVPYYESEQYQQDLEYWYNYYTQDRATGYEATLRAELDDLLNSNTLSAEDRNEAILIKLGWDFRLENYMDSEKRTIADDGTVTYSLGIGNWWAKLFGNGTEEDTLPQTQAEGDALYKIYCENYEEWISVLKGVSE